MKSILTIALILIAFTGFTQIKPAVSGTTYGDGAKSKGAISITALEEKLASTDTYNGRVKGVVLNVCEKKGCWMKLQQANGEGIMIRFKTIILHAKDIVGKEVVVTALPRSPSLR